MTVPPRTPVLSASPSDVGITPSAPNRLENPTFVTSPAVGAALATAAGHLRAGRTVAFPTETVYGLGAHSLNPDAVAKVYDIKGRPRDNPLIIHVSSLAMLRRLLPTNYALSPLYLALVDAYWPGPLTLLFPNPSPPPAPAPQTNGIRMPDHPLALALIAAADLPVSAPSANSSGRPSPTRAAHVAHDLDGAEGLGCILDGGACGVGVESTVVDGLGWKQGGGGSVNVLRPGGLGVEDIAKVVAAVDAKYGGYTDILVHGKPWRRGSTSTAPLPKPNPDAAPSTPGMKYRHYSPRVPVYLFLPSTVFPRPAISSSVTAPNEVVRALAAKTQGRAAEPKFGLLHYANSPLSKALASVSGVQMTPRSLGPDATSAAAALFDGLLELEADGTDAGVDAIIVEGCADDGLGLAVMERVGKAVGGGGVTGALGNGQGASDAGRFWVQV
ncbi:Threonylcarbamoyl-AMP synthase [Vanrija pseudolonga]|uniref:Threonylcarbamoyl-AMP synthase n=1 Tax=Vanrija pseudolonga TaxID=143232 RepID=A0AAF1BSV8_9TREE|nr:Threonylcarbamoyl-AMP synthase [Vanrija pseudolonga]